MQPALAIPFHDPDGKMFPHLQAILPDLKEHFQHLYVCLPSSTQQYSNRMQQLQADNFFTVFPIDHEMKVGREFAYLYQRTAEIAPPDQMIHLCFLDRLSFALEGKYRDAFLADVDSLSTADVPLVFQRSELAWQTHPQNYRDLEGIVTTVGRNLFGRDLDYAWCHMVVRAGQLREIIPFVKNLNISMVAEVLFYLQEDVRTRTVDWLAWEDPFILGRDAIELKHARENSLEETHKRLSYTVPMIETLTRLSQMKTKKNKVEDRCA